MPAKKRGMSLEDKRDTILNIFHETKDVFVLKVTRIDIEKLASKRGVVLQSVKDVLQSLVDDDLVNQDKIGISNFFWSFPSEAAVKLNNEQEKLESKLSSLEKESTVLKDKVEKARVGKEDSKERQDLDKRVQVLSNNIAEKKRELEEFAENDPERFEQLKKAKTECRDSVNRWTDNIFILKSWMKKKFTGMDKQIDGFFVQQGIPDDLDYVE
eukprot:jgi/Picsp_1/1845/NSC_05312-R1_meiotic nuclear division protein 1 homolog